MEWFFISFDQRKKKCFFMQKILTFFYILRVHKIDLLSVDFLFTLMEFFLLSTDKHEFVCLHQIKFFQRVFF